jgi:hypothetical protein
MTTQVIENYENHNANHFRFQQDGAPSHYIQVARKIIRFKSFILFLMGTLVRIVRI